MIFAGNPGTGKTTVARMIGKIYQQLGILPRGHRTIECTRSDLVGKYLGHTAALVKQKFHEAEGSVLFIDEAYSICRDDNDQFGMEAVHELTAQLENHRNSVLVILVGYNNQINDFLEKNPGLKSRFNTWINFEDYSEEDMVKIFKGMISKSQKKLADKTDELI